MRAEGSASRALVAARTLAVACVLALTSPVASTAYADHGGPSAAAVAASKAQVARLEREVAAAAARVERAQQSLDQARTAAEIAVEAFDRAQVKQQAAARAAAAARIAADAAAARTAQARSSVARFAKAAYEGGALSSLDALLTADGPGAMLYRLGELGAVSRSQRDVLQALSAAQVYQRVVQHAADAALAAAAQAASAAAAARAAAARLVDGQATALTRLSTAQHQLAETLAGARAHASALERARLAALARARAEAAARAARARAEQLRAEQLRAQQQAQSSGATTSAAGAGSSGGATVSAATEQGALHAAESQLGKPYEWGAAGPDSYDCSGLVMWAYAQVGVHVDHWTGYQWNEGEHIPLSSLRPGDLLFFATDTSDPNTIHHVGMYVGNATMIEAPYTGANVRYSNAFRPDLIGAVRFYQR
jgi:cell wall-associated NlpC family hydrolase